MRLAFCSLVALTLASLPPSYAAAQYESMHCRRTVNNADIHLGKFNGLIPKFRKQMLDLNANTHDFSRQCEIVEDMRRTHTELNGYFSSLHMGYNGAAMTCKLPGNRRKYGAVLREVNASGKRAFLDKADKMIQGMQNKCRARR